MLCPTVEAGQGEQVLKRQPTQAVIQLHAAGEVKGSHIRIVEVPSGAFW